MLSLTGHVTAFDHFRQRLYLIENVFLAPDADDATRRRDAYDAAVGAARRRWSTSWPGRCRTCPSPPPADELDRAARRSRPRRCADVVPARGRGGAGAHPRRRHLPGRARPALRPRRTGRPVRRVPGAAPGEPVAVHVLPAPSRGDARRLVARADGAAARRAGDQPPDRRAPAAGAAPRSTTGAWPPSSSSTRRSGPST